MQKTELHIQLVKKQRQEAPTKSNQGTKCIENKQQHKFATCLTVKPATNNKLDKRKKPMRTRCIENKVKHDTRNERCKTKFAKKGRKWENT